MGASLPRFGCESRHNSALHHLVFILSNGLIHNCAFIIKIKKNNNPLVIAEVTTKYTVQIRIAGIQDYRYLTFFTFNQHRSSNSN